MSAGKFIFMRREYWTSRTKNSEISLEKYHEFFNAVNDLFHYHQGKIAIRHDHSLAYRHRNKKLYPYRNYTIQELTGLVNMIFDDIVDPQKPEIQNIPTQFFLQTGIWPWFSLLPAITLALITAQNCSKNSNRKFREHIFRDSMLDMRWNSLFFNRSEQFWP